MHVSLDTWAEMHKEQTLTHLRSGRALRMNACQELAVRSLGTAAGDNATGVRSVSLMAVPIAGRLPGLAVPGGLILASRQVAVLQRLAPGGRMGGYLSA